MNLSLYKPSELEKWICRQYQDNSVFDPRDLSIDHVATIFDIEVEYYRGKSFVNWDEGGEAVIYLDNRLSLEEQREQFFHELCHPLKHVGCQDRMPKLFKELQEIQAKMFQLYSAIPFYMLEEYQQIVQVGDFIVAIAHDFKLPINFVKDRVTQIMTRIQQEEIRRSTIKTVVMSQLAPKPSLEFVSTEAFRLIDQALQQKRFKDIWGIDKKPQRNYENWYRLMPKRHRAYREWKEETPR